MLLLFDKGERYYEDKDVYGATINDVDMNLVNDYIQVIGYSKSAMEYLRENNDFVTEVDGQQKISTACILLFGKKPQRFFPRARTRFIRYEGTEEKVGTEMNVIKDVTFEGAILNQVRCTIDYLETQVREHTFLGQDGRFVTNRNYPKFAIQEMVVNSCCHRAYNIKGTEIQIKMFDDRLVFETPGDLPGLVRPDNIRHTHFSRNPKIAQYLKAYKYVKEFGEGIDRICNELETRGSAIPSFLINAFILKATLKAEWTSEKELEQPGITQTEQGTTQITTQNTTQITAHKLTEIQQKIVNALISNPSVSRKQLATLIGDITEDGIKYHLKKLQQTGVIARIGADNVGYWEVNQKVLQ